MTSSTLGFVVMEHLKKLTAELETAFYAAAESDKAS
jgi:hypothetical protein